MTKKKINMSKQGKYYKNKSTCIDYFRETLPGVYIDVQRKCLKCDRSFTTDHKFVRLCSNCKHIAAKNERSHLSWGAKK